MHKATKEASIVDQVDPCPNCGSDQLTPAAAGKVLCLSCRRCWEVRGDVVRWVSPARCDGCALRPFCLRPVPLGPRVAVLSAPVRHHRRGRARRASLDALPGPLPPAA